MNSFEDPCFINVLPISFEQVYGSGWGESLTESGQESNLISFVNNEKENEDWMEWVSLDDDEQETENLVENSGHMTSFDADSHISFDAPVRLETSIFDQTQYPFMTISSSETYFTAADMATSDLTMQEPNPVQVTRPWSKTLTTSTPSTETPLLSGDAIEFWDIPALWDQTLPFSGSEPLFPADVESTSMVEPSPFFTASTSTPIIDDQKAEKVKLNESSSSRKQVPQLVESYSDHEDEEEEIVCQGNSRDSTFSQNTQSKTTATESEEPVASDDEMISVTLAVPTPLIKLPSRPGNWRHMVLERKKELADLSKKFPHTSHMQHPTSRHPTSSGSLHKKQQHPLVTKMATTTPSAGNGSGNHPHGHIQKRLYSTSNGIPRASSFRPLPLSESDEIKNLRQKLYGNVKMGHGIHVH